MPTTVRQTSQTSAEVRHAPALRSPAAEVVTVEGLTKRFGTVLAVDDLTFSLAAGTITGFLGPNGAGKTTTLRMLLGLIEPSAGSAHIFGRRYREHTHPARKVGAVLEAADFHPGRSGLDHLISLALAARIPTARVHEVLELVGLVGAERRRVGTYSLGMRQRLGLAAALLGKPELLILDEPANGLDPEGIHWLRALLRDMAEAGKTVLVSSHILAEVAQTVDRVVIIDKGRLVTTAELDELTERMARGVRVRTTRAQELVPFLAAAGLETTSVDDGELLVRGAPPRQVSALAAEAGIALDELVQESSSLERVFLELTSEAER